MLGGGGITPDVILPSTPLSPSDTAFQHMLGTQVPKFRDALTDYALSLKGSHAITSPDFVVTPEMRAELLRRMEARGVKVDASDVRGRELGSSTVCSATRSRGMSFGERGEFARRLRDDPWLAATQRDRRGANDAGANLLAGSRRGEGRPSPRSVGLSPRSGARARSDDATASSDRRP